MSIHQEETTSQPRGLTEPITFIAIQAITYLNTHQIDAAISLLEAKAADPERLTLDRIKDLSLLRRAYEEVRDEAAVLATAQREWAMFDSVTMPVARVQIRERLGNFYNRHGKHEEAFALADEADLICEQESGQHPEGTQAWLGIFCGKAKTARFEALLGLGQFDEAQKVIVERERRVSNGDSPTKLWFAHAQYAFAEVSAGIAPRYGEGPAFWLQKILSDPSPYPASDRAPEFSWEEYREICRGMESLIATPNMNWSHPNDVAGRAEIQWAVALRMLTYMSNDTELVSRSRAAARVTEKKFQIVWPYYREDFHFIY